jgi:UDP-N-acetylmuramoylalanine--D-glutamate ligase
MKIAIAGYGIEGETNYRYWAANSDNHVAIINQTQPDRPVPPDAQLIVGPDVFENLDGYDMVIRSPGLAPRKIVTKTKVWSGTNEFFAKCPAPIIGVTGSKGKGTTASLIAAILEASNKKTWLVGNIGVAALDILPDITPNDVVVYELSSFQLWDIETSPHTAVVLYIEQEHLDVHADMDEYVSAKGNIGRFQTSDDIMIYNQDNVYSRQIADWSPAMKVGYPSVRSTHIRDSAFYNGDTRLCDVSALQLVGDHNIDNACAAIDAVWAYTTDVAAIEAGLRSFKGLPHRLQVIREVDGVRYVDDSIATTPRAAIAALRSFDGSKVIILGGSSKGSDFTELGIELTKHTVKAILIGDEGPVIAAACDAAGFSDYQILDHPTADRIVDAAHHLATTGSTVLLSPASASFGLFKNYADRGDQFARAVYNI